MRLKVFVILSVIPKGRNGGETIDARFLPCEIFFAHLSIISAYSAQSFNMCSFFVVCSRSSILGLAKMIQRAKNAISQWEQRVVLWHQMISKRG